MGKGATARVRMVRKRNSSGHLIYAAKEFNIRKRDEDKTTFDRNIKEEFSIARRLQHNNIISTFSLCKDGGRWSYVMEHCDSGDLFSLVKQGYLSTKERLGDRLCLFKQLVQGLEYLHANGIAHRDIKLENILLTKKCHLKITDFGVATVFTKHTDGTTISYNALDLSWTEINLCAPGVCGSPPYLPPEVMARQGLFVETSQYMTNRQTVKYDPRLVDVWSAAIVMINMCFGGSLWKEAVPCSSQYYTALISGWAEWLHHHRDETNPIFTDTDYPRIAFLDRKILSSPLKRLLIRMLNPEPAARATIRDITKDGWFKRIECCQSPNPEGCGMACDRSVSRCTTGKSAKIVRHNHMPPKRNYGHMLLGILGEG